VAENLKNQQKGVGWPKKGRSENGRGKVKGKVKPDKNGDLGRSSERRGDLGGEGSKRFMGRDVWELCERHRFHSHGFSEARCSGEKTKKTGEVKWKKE